MSAVQQALMGSYGGIDPYYWAVTSLLHFDGTNGSTTFTDQTGKAWTANGNAQLSTAWSAFGTASGLFDGAGDHVDCPASGSNFNFSNQPFTVEVTVRHINTATNAGYAMQWGTTTALQCWALFLSAGSLFFRFATSPGVYVDCTAAWAPVAGTAYRIAADRDASNNLRIYVDGVVLATISTAGTMQSTAGGLQIGWINNNPGTFDLNGYLDELRVTKGIARYAGAYTIAAAAFPNS